MLWQLLLEISTYFFTMLTMAISDWEEVRVFKTTEMRYSDPSVLIHFLRVTWRKTCFRSKGKFSNCVRVHLFRVRRVVRKWLKICWVYLFFSFVFFLRLRISLFLRLSRWAENTLRVLFSFSCFRLASWTFHLATFSWNIRRVVKVRLGSLLLSWTVRLRVFWLEIIIRFTSIIRLLKVLKRLILSSFRRQLIQLAFLNLIILCEEVVLVRIRVSRIILWGLIGRLRLTSFLTLARCRIINIHHVVISLNRPIDSNHSSL